MKPGLLGLSLLLCLLVGIRNAALCGSAAAGDSSPSLTFDTTLFTRNDVEVKSRLTGIIDRIYVDRGSWVKKGYPLAELQNNDLALEVKKAEVSMEQSKVEYDRAKSLFDQKLSSESDYDARRLGYERSTAEYELAKVEYEKSIIKAPFTGVVDELYAKLGQRVVEDENVPLFRITALEPLQARVFVPEEQIRNISVGLKAEFVAAISPSRRFSARVTWISSSIDPASGTAPAIVELYPGEGRGFLKPGTSGKITIWMKSTNVPPSR